MSEADPYAGKRKRQSDEGLSNVATTGDAEQRNTEAIKRKSEEAKSSSGKKKED